MVNSWSAFWLLCILLLNTAATDVQIGRFGCFWVVLFQFWALVTAHNTHPRNRLNWTRSERKRDRSSFTLNNDQSSCVWIFHWTPHVTHSPSNNRMSERNSRYSPVAFRLRDQRSWKPFSPFFFFLSRLHDLCPLSSKAPKLWPEGWRQNSSGRPIVNLMTTPSVGGVDITSAFFQRSASFILAMLTRNRFARKFSPWDQIRFIQSKLCRIIFHQFDTLPEQEQHNRNLPLFSLPLFKISLT